MQPKLNKRQRAALVHRLVQARDEARLTQKQVAATQIISQSELSKIENGQRGVEFLLVVRLAKLYKKDLSFFVPVD